MSVLPFKAPEFDVDAEVRAYLEVAEKIEHLTSKAAAIKARLRENLPHGKTDTSFGMTVTVSPPSRSFDLAKALTMLTPEQLAVCQSPDAKKVKGQLAGAVVEALMLPGKGDDSVAIK
jgi:hypothetical protein